MKKHLRKQVLFLEQGTGVEPMTKKLCALKIQREIKPLVKALVFFVETAHLLDVFIYIFC